MHSCFLLKQIKLDCQRARCINVKIVKFIPIEKKASTAVIFIFQNIVYSNSTFVSVQSMKCQAIKIQIK